jgi:hypothetical protein
MKKRNIVLFLSVLVIFFSCTEKTTEVKEVKEIKKEVIIVKDTPPKSTTIKIDTKGLKVEGEKVNIKVNNK